MTCPVINKNEGKLDRILRIIIGFIVLIVGYALLTGIAQLIAYIIAVVALITGSMGFCGLYAIFGITTRPKRETKQTNK